MSQPLLNDAEFVGRLRKRLAGASRGDRYYERPMNWDEADRFLTCHDELLAALKATVGNMLNAKIALDVGDTKAKVSAQLASALKSAEDALAKATQP